MGEVRVTLQPWEDSLSHCLSLLGIPAIVEETVTENYDDDPWAPAGDGYGVSILLDEKGANRLTEVLEKAWTGRIERAERYEEALRRVAEGWAGSLAEYVAEFAADVLREEGRL